MVVEMNRIELIKKLYEDEKWSISELSRRFGHDRKTIRKYVEGANVKYSRDEDWKNPVKDQIMPLIEKWYAEDLKGPRKQRRTAKRMYDLLKSEYGFSCGYSTVKTALAGLRGSNREVFVPRNHKPGEYLEFDFGYAKIRINGVLTQVAMHCFQLTYSNDIFVYCSIRETQEEIFESHKRAFMHFGGITKAVRYDNLRQVVKKVLQGSRREEQAAFRTFREQMGFEAEFCEVRKGWQKGDVEGCVGYARRNYLSPIPEVKDLDELNEGFKEWCLSLRKTRIVFGTQETVGAFFQMEQVEFLELAGSLPEVGKRRIGTVNHYALVCVEKVYYSVPTEHAYKKVDVLITTKEVVISTKEKEIARHKRCFEKGRQIFDPVHYLPLFIKKPYAILNSKPLIELPRTFHLFFERAYQKGYATVQDCVQVLSLLKANSVNDLVVALELAMTYQTYYFDGVKNILTQLKSGNEVHKKLSRIEDPDGKLRAEIPQVDLTRYDKLISEEIL